MCKKIVSIVIPAYNEEQMIKRTATVVSKILDENSMEYEIIFVNDGSKDSTWIEIEKAYEICDKIKGINFSRNFGKEAAIFAGLEYATGDCVVCIDCDLQHPPEKIVEMYHLWKQGFEVVEGIKVDRGKESFIHKGFANLFYKIISSATEIDMSKASDFKLMDRKVVDTLLKMPEKNVFFRALSSWVGFKSISVEFEVQEREAGESKWSFKSLASYAIKNITIFTAAPMQIITIFGIIFGIFAFILGAHSLYSYICGQAQEGFTTVILLLLIIGCILMSGLGIIGYYISKIYEEVKGRPRYIVSSVIGKEHHNEKNDRKE